jgi:hypothetical protein
VRNLQASGEAPRIWPTWRSVSRATRPHAARPTRASARSAHGSVPGLLGGMRRCASRRSAPGINTAAVGPRTRGWRPPGRGGEGSFRVPRRSSAAALAGRVRGRRTRPGASSRPRSRRRAASSRTRTLSAFPRASGSAKATTPGSRRTACPGRTVGIRRTCSRPSPAATVAPGRHPRGPTGAHEPTAFPPSCLSRQAPKVHTSTRTTPLPACIIRK